MTHICVSKIISIGADNGLSPGRRQAIIWTSAGILSIGPLGTNCSEIWIEVHTFSFKKMHFKMSAKWRPFCLGLNVLNSFKTKTTMCIYCISDILKLVKCAWATKGAYTDHMITAACISWVSWQKGPICHAEAWLVGPFWQDTINIWYVITYPYHNLCLNSLWPNDTIWGHISASTSPQVVACCLMAPSHYLNQCWLIISGVLWPSPKTYFTGSAQDINW